MKEVKKSLYLNIIIVILEIFSLAWMMSGIKLIATSDSLTASRLAMFKYFTVDSNFIVGIISAIAIFEEFKILKSKKKDLSNITYILKLLGTTSITLTMLVTIIFLAPTMGLGVVFTDSNLFLHVINPIVCILTFTKYERTRKIKFKHTLTACIPLIIYATYYVTLSMIHMENGIVQPGYDWYGFFFFGIKSVIIILPIIIAVTYLISLILWKINNIKGEK